MGYEGDLELALIPESFRTEVLMEQLDDNGVLIENAQVELASFALLFEFDGDQRHIRHVLYNCAASRPGIEGKTNEDTQRGADRDTYHQGNTAFQWPCKSKDR